MYALHNLSTFLSNPLYKSDVIFVVEGTASCEAYLNELKQTYILPTLEYFNGGPLGIGQNDSSVDIPDCFYGLVIFHAADVLPGYLTETYGPITTPQEVLTRLENYKFAGGHEAAQSFVGEGLATAMQCLEDITSFRTLSSPEIVKRHVILICNCEPYGLPVTESVGANGMYRGKSAVEIVSQMNHEQDVHLSIFAPRKIPALISLFEQGGGDSTSQKGHAKDFRHLVLLNRFDLQEGPAERVDAPSRSEPTENAPRPISVPQEQSQPSWASCRKEGLPSFFHSCTSPASVPSSLQQMNNSPARSFQSFASTSTSSLNNLTRNSPQKPVTFNGTSTLQNVHEMQNQTNFNYPANQPGQQPMINNQVQMTPGHQQQMNQNISTQQLQRRSKVNLQIPMGHQANPLLAATTSSASLQTVQHQLHSPAFKSYRPVDVGMTTQGMQVRMSAQQPMPSSSMQSSAFQQQLQQPQQQNQSQFGFRNLNEQMQVQTQHQEEMQTIWNGTLQWRDRQNGPQNGNSSYQHVPCSISVSTVNGEPRVCARGWPTKVTMQLIPNSILGSMGGNYLVRNVRRVLFTMQRGDALNSLTRVMDKGNVGIVHIIGIGVESYANKVKVLILIHNKNNGTYLGFIPNDQVGFVDRALKENFRMKELQAERQGQSSGGSSQQTELQVPGPSTGMVQFQHTQGSSPVQQQSGAAPSVIQTRQSQVLLRQQIMERQESVRKMQAHNPQSGQVVHDKEHQQQHSIAVRCHGRTQAQVTSPEQIFPPQQQQQTTDQRQHVGMVIQSQQQRSLILRPQPIVSMHGMVQSLPTPILSPPAQRGAVPSISLDQYHFAPPLQQLRQPGQSRQQQVQTSYFQQAMDAPQSQAQLTLQETGRDDHATFQQNYNDILQELHCSTNNSSPIQGQAENWRQNFPFQQQQQVEPQRMIAPQNIGQVTVQRQIVSQTSSGFVSPQQQYGPQNFYLQRNMRYVTTQIQDRSTMQQSQYVAQDQSEDEDFQQNY